MKAVHIEDNIYMVTGWPGSSGFIYDIEANCYTIQVNEHDAFEKCLQRGLAEIRERKEAIAAWQIQNEKGRAAK